MTDPVSEQNHRVLIVDDNPAIHQDFIKIFREETPSTGLEAVESALFGETKRQTIQVRYELDSAYQGKEALEKVTTAVEKHAPYAVAFVDMRMPPGWDGAETIQNLWKADPNLQVVICTAYSDFSWEEIVARLGAGDRLLILKKPFDSAEVSQLALALTEKWGMTRQASLRMVDLEQMVDQRTTQLQRALEKLKEEVSQREMAEERLRYSAFHDPLTNLPNRALLLDRLGRCLARVKRQPDYCYAILFIDLDGFKVVNDSLGHRAGDDLLIGVAQRLATAVRSLDSVTRPGDDTTARLGGDEFVILLDGIRDIGTAQEVAHRILGDLVRPYTLGDGDVTVGASIGIAGGHAGYALPEEVLRDADTALYRAKESGKGCVTLFDGEMRSAAVNRLEIENDLRRAVDRQQVSIQYQPLVSLSTGLMQGLEALVRWKHPQRGWISPGEFIPIAEEIGLIVPLGKWILHEACRQAQQWRTRFPQWAALTVSINISPRQFRDPKLFETIDAALGSTKLPPENLCLEVTESAVMDNPALAKAMLAECKARRLAVHMDDFGTGYSSLSYLHNLPLDAVKIDRAFVQNMRLDGEHASTVQAIVTLAHNRGLIVIAEGIETPEQFAQLQALDCDQGQGFYFAKPLSVADADNLLIAGGMWRAKCA